ncbi:hypothetical protein KGQ34_00470 [Patescibacteria group bacterium]|nr:hypothetical protein [Patescibacteria group bacterium]
MKGSSLIEIIVGLAVIATALLFLGNIAQYSLRLVETSTMRLQATFLLSEGAEAVKTMRDRGWTANINPLPLDTDSYLAFSANQWQATATPETIDNAFSRKFTVAGVQRNSSDDIVASGGTVDPNTKKITVTVSWNQGSRPFSESISTYITNLFNN